jgi:hypothetical protein
MGFSRLKKASDYEVNDWLVKKLDLTPYQKSKLRDDEIVRFSPFTFMKNRQKEKVSFLWRTTILLIPFYILLVWTYNPIQFIFSGKWGISSKFLDSFHYPWMNKINLNL